MTTFYVACTSADNGVTAGRRAYDLTSLGMRSAFDWWRHVNATKEEYPLLARHDVDAAKHADLFVLDYSIATPGGMLELGVRIAAGKQAHVVCESPHFFFAHDLMRVHATWQAFLDFVRPPALWPRERTTPAIRPVFGATGDTAPHGLYGVRPTLETINHGLAACSRDDPQHDGPCNPVDTLQALGARLDKVEAELARRRG